MPYGVRIPEEELRSLVRRRIDARHLPIMIANNVTASYGSGECCSLCDQPIERQHVCYEVEPGLGFHVNCHSVWQLECVRRMSGQEVPENQAAKERMTVARS